MAQGNASTARIGVAIRDRRIDLGMTQDDLSLTTGISRTKLSAMENGRFGSVRLMMEVCDALGLELFAANREDAGRVTQTLKLTRAPQRRRRVSRSSRDARG